MREKVVLLADTIELIARDGKGRVVMWKARGSDGKPYLSITRATWSDLTDTTQRMLVRKAQS